MTTPIRRAATVLLVRDAPKQSESVRDAPVDHLQVWMMHRIAALNFAAGAHVFPGGAVEDGDSVALADVPSDLDGVDIATLSPAMGLPPAEAAAVVRAAVREIHEEADVRLNPAGLVPWAWWLTPDHIPVRYDTWFFLYDARAGIAPEHIDGGEAVTARWWGVNEALTANRHGSIMLLWPTLLELLALSSTRSVDEALNQRPQQLQRRSG